MRWVRDGDAKRVRVAVNRTMGRVACGLLALARDHGEPDETGVSIQLRLTQQDLADFTSASIESASRAVHEMREPGWIATGRRAWRAEALRRMAV